MPQNTICPKCGTPFKDFLPDETLKSDKDKIEILRGAKCHKCRKSFSWIDVYCFDPHLGIEIWEDIS